MAFLQNNNLYSGRMGPVIIVTLNEGTGAQAMPLRARDFTPTKTPQEVTSGGAAAFLDFLEHEVIPFIDRTYRTIPSDRGLLAHSYGGLFAIYTLEQRPALFRRIVAASPVVGWDDRLLSKVARDRLRSLLSPVRLDLSVGGDGPYSRHDGICQAAGRIEAGGTRISIHTVSWRESQFHAVGLIPRGTLLGLSVREVRFLWSSR